MDIVIYHNPQCGTSRRTLDLIREAGLEPHVVEYLKTPPTRAMLQSLLARMGISARQLLRRKGAPLDELRLGDPNVSEDQILEAMVAHPILIERPIVVTPKGVRLCRPAETVLELLPQEQTAPLRQETAAAP